MKGMNNRYLLRGSLTNNSRCHRLRKDCKVAPKKRVAKSIISSQPAPNKNTTAPADSFGGLAQLLIASNGAGSEVSLHE